MQINIAELKSAVEKAEAGVDAGEAAHANVLFEGARVFSYNDEIAVSAPAPDMGGKITVAALPLLRLLREWDAETAEVSTEGTMFVLSGSKNKATMAIEQSSFPTLQIPDKWKSLPERFCKAVKSCLPSAASDASNPVLSCIHAAESVVESCDNFRLTRCSLDSPMPAPVLINAIYAQRFIQHKPKAMGKPGDWLHFKCEGDVVFSCRATSGEYPDIGKLIASGKKMKMPGGVLEALNRAGVFSEGEFEQDNHITVILENGVMKIKSQNGAGSYREKLKCDYEGEPVQFQIHPSYLRDAVDLSASFELCGNSIKVSTPGMIHVVSLTV